MAMQVKQVTDPAFGVYGRIVEGYGCGELIGRLKETPVTDGVVYVPSVPELEESADGKRISEGLYGGMPIQIGYCNGHNKKLNAVEYHRDSEINIAAEDMILILGRQQEIEADYTYDTSRMEAFLIPAGTVVEVYATTLHYAPCHVGDGSFRCGVVLPRGTNTDIGPVTVAGPEDRLLFARNKWLIGHAEGGLPEGAFIGLKGENLSVD